MNKVIIKKVVKGSLNATAKLFDISGSVLKTGASLIRGDKQLSVSVKDKQ